MNFKFIKFILEKKKWTVIFISFVILFTVPFYAFTENLTRKDIFLAWVVNLFALVAFSAISLFLKGKWEKTYLIILFILFLFPNMIVFSYMYIASMHMYHDMFWVIFATNPAESQEYIDEAVPWRLIWCIIGYIVVASFLLFLSLSSKSSSISSSLKKNKIFFTFCVVVLVIIASSQVLSKSFGSIDFYKSSYQFFAESYRLKKEVTSYKRHEIDVSCGLKQTGNTFVVVIGESLSRNHMQIYGYHRKTTPMLDSMKTDLHIYTDVISPNTHTIAVLKSVLTFADQNHPKYYFDKPSIVDLFESAGFTTYWISNQELLSKWGGSYGIIAQGANYVYDLSSEKKTDEIVLPTLYEILEEKKDENKIIFIHLMGSHNAYKCRYPANFSYFNYETDTIPNKPYLRDESRRLIDEYDNSVLYTDFILSSIIKKMQEKEDSPSVVLFFSDHAEEVFDFRDVVGHFIQGTSRFQCEIPFILWYSNGYKNEKTDLIFEENRPFITEDFIYSISSLAKLNYKDFEPERSLFESKFTHRERRVGDVTYEEVLQKKFKSRKKQNPLP